MVGLVCSGSGVGIGGSAIGERGVRTGERGDGGRSPHVAGPGVEVGSPSGGTVNSRRCSWDCVRARRSRSGSSPRTPGGRITASWTAASTTPARTLTPGPGLQSIPIRGSRSDRPRSQGDSRPRVGPPKQSVGRVNLTTRQSGVRSHHRGPTRSDEARNRRGDHRQRVSTVASGRRLSVLGRQSTETWSACGPFRPSVTTKETRWFSSRDL